MNVSLVAFLWWLSRSRRRSLTGGRFWVPIPGCSVWTGLNFPQCELGHTPAVASEIKERDGIIACKMENWWNSWHRLTLFLGHSPKVPLSKSAGDKNLQMSRQKTHLLVLNGDTGLAPPSCQSNCPAESNTSMGWKKPLPLAAWLLPLHAFFRTLRSAWLTFGARERPPTFRPPSQNPSEAHQSHQFRR